jgi:hypothetical protein
VIAKAYFEFMLTWKASPREFAEHLTAINEVPVYLVKMYPFHD